MELSQSKHTFRLLILAIFVTAINVGTTFCLISLVEISTLVGLSSSLLLGVLFTYLLTSSRFKRTLSRFAQQLVRAAPDPEQDQPLTSVEVEELAPVVKLIEEQREDIQNAANYITQLEKTETLATDKLQEEVQSSELVNAIIQVHKNLQQMAEQEQERNWVSQGLARFVTILRHNENISELGESIVSELVKYLGANQGGLFKLMKQEEADEHLELMACYAYERKKYLKKRIEIGEGLVGQTFLEKESTLLTEIPDSYVTITSGLGKSTPRNLLLVPLKINEEAQGVLELAAFKPFTPYQIEFVEKLGENIAAAFVNAESEQRTRQLLEESQQQTQQMREQEEEMRQNVEEMQATQEGMRRTQQQMQVKEQENERMLGELETIRTELQMQLEQNVAELKSEKARADVFYNATPDAILYLDESLLITHINLGGQKMFSYNPDQIVGKPLATIVQTDRPDELLQDYLSQVKQLGKCGEYTGKSNMYGFMFPISLAITEGEVDGHKVYTAIIRDNRKQKEQEERLQKTVNSAKETHEQLMQREQELKSIVQQLTEKEKEIDQLKTSK
ncbi:MAG: GAF domain-containing protein [Bacteroidota bacterium]